MRQGIPRIRVQRVYKLGRGHRVWESSGEATALHKLGKESLLVVLELLLPIPLVDDHALTNLLCIRQKLIEPNDRHGELMYTSES